MRVRIYIEGEPAPSLRHVVEQALVRIEQYAAPGRHINGFLYDANGTQIGTWEVAQ